MTQTTETITWLPVAAGTPPHEANVLLSNEDGSFEGFYDGNDDSGEPIFRDVTAMPVKGVTHYAEMPKGPAA